MLLIFVTIILNVRDELLLARGEAGLLFANDQFWYSNEWFVSIWISPSSEYAFYPQTGNQDDNVGYPTLYWLK